MSETYVCQSFQTLYEASPIINVTRTSFALFHPIMYVTHRSFAAPALAIRDFFWLYHTYILYYAGVSIMPPRVLASGPKPCGGNKCLVISLIQFTLIVCLKRFILPQAYWKASYTKFNILSMCLFVHVVGWPFLRHTNHKGSVCIPNPYGYAYTLKWARSVLGSKSLTLSYVIAFIVQFPISSCKNRTILQNKQPYKQDNQTNLSEFKRILEQGQTIHLRYVQSGFEFSQTHLGLYEPVQT